MPPDPCRAYRTLNDPRRSFLFPLLLIQLIPLPAVFLAPGPFKATTLNALLLAFAFLFLATLLVLTTAWRTTERAILASQNMRCPQCFYDLSSAPPDYLTCPECGSQMEQHNIKAHWQRYLENPIIHIMCNPFYRP